MARSTIALLAALAVAVIALPAEAQWKWRDKSGHVQYSDLPPPSGTADQDILARPSAQARRTATTALAPATATSAAASPSSASAAASSPRTGDSELEAKRKKAEAEAAAKAKADQERNAAQRADNCTRAKGQLATLDSGIRLAHTNPKTGEREFLDDKQRADEARRTRDIIASDCK
jgi:hypothetical protein